MLQSPYKHVNLAKKNLPLTEGDLEWADSVTGKPKAELLQFIAVIFFRLWRCGGKCVKIKGIFTYGG